MSTFHVSPKGSDGGDGTPGHPLRSINDACARAAPGDLILLGDGLYREWIDPIRGGSGPDRPLTIAAAEGASPVVSGAEPIAGWEPIGDGLWTVRLPNAWFKGTHTLRTGLGGDWFWHKKQPQHLGELFCDGLPMIEVADREAVRAREPWAEAVDPGCTRLAWCVESEPDACRIVACFDGANPSSLLVELSVREACLYPRRTGVDWVHVRGIEFRHAASPWAPPTAQQIGMVGPNWARGWIIEDCHLHHARCCAISLGAPGLIGDNRWTRERVKHGTQRERESVFTALHHGWSQAVVGSHQVRRNHIHDCEQAGIVGHLGAIFSEIHGNHIHHIHVRRRFGGHEMAGIKLHAPIDARIRDNHLHDCIRGIWLDWQAQGTRVQGNLCHHNAADDFYIEVCHGPAIVDHNCFLSRVAVKNCSQGTAFVHNLIGGAVTLQPVPNRYTPYHRPHTTEVMGLMTILGGDDRWLNNLFVAPEEGADTVRVEDENADLLRDSAPRPSVGLSCYDPWPGPGEDWIPSGSVNAYAAAKLPVHIGVNVFTQGTRPGRHGKPASMPVRPTWRLERIGERCRVILNGAAGLPRLPTLAADALGVAFQAECPFEDPSGTLADWTCDAGGHRRGATCIPGPADDLTGHSWLCRVHEPMHDQPQMLKHAPPGVAQAVAPSGPKAGLSGIVTRPTIAANHPDLPTDS